MLSSYPSPQRVGNTSAALNGVLKDWSSRGCNGTVVFTSPGASLRLDYEYTLGNISVVLDASGLSSPVTLLAAPQSRHFQVTGPSANLTTINIILNGAYRSSPSPSAHLKGGALYADDGAVAWLIRTTFTNNTVAGLAPNGTACGGAAYLSGAQLYASNCTFSSNTARSYHKAYGGAIYIESPTSSPAFHSVDFESNVARANGTYARAAEGAAVYCSANSGVTPVFDGCTFSGGLAAVGSSAITGAAARGGALHLSPCGSIYSSQMTGNYAVSR